LHYPGIELVVEPELSAGNDPYLAEHALEGDPLFPAVMGLEAMAQAAMALLGEDRPPRFEAVELLRPVAVPPDIRLPIRIAALARDGLTVDLVLRSAEDGFQQDRFRARARVDSASGSAGELPRLELEQRPPTGLEMERDIYEPLLFHTGRFRRILGYTHLDARGCGAEVGEGDGRSWFAPLMPPDLVLGDPGSRDAGLHAIQACIPQARLLPVGAERIHFGDTRVAGPWSLRARETARDGDLFTYDMELRGADGTLREAWQGLRLRPVAPIEHAHWHPALLVPYLERRLSELMPGIRISLALEREEAEARGERSTLAMQRALGAAQSILYRADGRPETADGRGISASHAGPFTLAAAAGIGLTCDLEPVAHREEGLWGELLGSEYLMLARVVSNTLQEGLDRAATRVWTGLECLKKDGAAVGSPLALSATEPDGWAVLASGGRRIATGAVRVRGQEGELVVALLEEPLGARL
jgi:enediyne polyketide synthase